MQTASPQTYRETRNTEAAAGQIGARAIQVTKNEMSRSRQVVGRSRTFSLGNASLSSNATLAPALAR